METRQLFRPEWLDHSKGIKKSARKNDGTREKKDPWDQNPWNLSLSEKKSGEILKTTGRCEWILRNGKNRNTQCRSMGECGKFCKNHKVCGIGNKTRKKELYMQKQKTRVKEGLMPPLRQEHKQLQEAIDKSLRDEREIIAKSLEEYERITRNLEEYAKLENYFDNKEGWKADHRVSENYFESVEEKMEKESSTTSQ